MFADVHVVPALIACVMKLYVNVEISLRSVCLFACIRATVPCSGTEAANTTSSDETIGCWKSFRRGLANVS